MREKREEEEKKLHKCEKINGRDGRRNRSKGVTEKERGREKRRIERQQDQTHCLLSLQCALPSFSLRLQTEINR